jgi:hypothetical protein
VTEFEKELEAAVVKAIEQFGFQNFKQLPMFGSNGREVELKLAA